MNKKLSKLIDQECKICGENDIDVLETHRIKFGCDGGKYVPGNTATLCCNCHTKIHKDKIKIQGKYYCTDGTWKIIYTNEQGKEIIK
jgi:hypothetical protein